MAKRLKIIDTDKGLKKIKRNLKILNGQIVKVGLFDSTGGGPSVNIAARGAVHENGSTKRNIPRRPFMAKAFDNNKNFNNRVIEKGVNKVIAGRIGPTSLVKNVGNLHENQIKASINSGEFKPLKSETIRKKGSSKPLIDQAIMLNSVKFRLARKGL